MAHANRNFKTKKALKEAVNNGERVYLTSPIFSAPTEGIAFVEGPWDYHKWYAEVTLHDGLVTAVK